MKYFEASGLWYPSDDPDNAVGGTLRFDEDGLQLILLGSFRQGWSPEAERYPMIHGVVGDSPYGAFVTLMDCFRTGQKFNLVGATSERIWCQKATLGSFHLSEEPIHFQSVELDFTCLTEWIGPGGLKGVRKLDDDRSYVLEYQRPDKETFIFDENALTLLFVFSTEETAHRTSLTEAARLLVQPGGDLTPANLGQDYIGRLQNLLSFATDRPNGVEEIVYWAKDDRKGVTRRLNLLYDPVFRAKEAAGPLHPADMLFTYGDSQAAGLNIFQKWLDFSRKHQGFCDVYFAHTYATPRYLDQRFAMVAAAFTLLCSSLRQTSTRTKLFLAVAEEALKTHFSDEERVIMGHILPTEHQVEMPIHLLSLLKENAGLMGQVIEDFPQFVRSVSNTLVFVEQRAKGKRPPLEERDLFYVLEKMKMLTRILVLKELGFGDDKVQALVERNQWFNQLKSL